MSFVSAQSLEPFRTILGQIETAYQSKDLSLLEGLYGEDVLYLSSSQRIGLKDRNHLFHHVFGKMMNNVDATYDIEFKIVDGKQYADSGFLGVYFKYSRTINEGEESIFYGKILFLFEQNESGAWQIRGDADSRCPSEVFENAVAL